MEKKIALALESRLKKCSNVLTLGVKTNLEDYTDYEIQLIHNARKIYYPTSFYADLFDTIGKDIFPSYHTYKCVQDKVKQSALFKLAGLPHPKTRVFYGKRKHDLILSHFKFPFIGKVARGSALGKGVFLIKDRADLDVYVQGRHVMYFQEYLPIDRDIRVVVMGPKVVCAYWRIAAEGEFRSNVSRGGTISFDSVPEKALELAIETCRKCGWNDVGIDICEHDGRLYLIEANMKYGKAGFRAAGIDYYKMLEQMIDKNEI